MISLSNVNKCSIAPQIQKLVDEFNKKNRLYNEECLVYKHLTFEKLINVIENILSDRDYDFLDILNDYREYCNEQGLIDDRYQLMKVYAVGDTLEINKKLNLYYRKATDNITTDILGLYKDKKVVCIGRIYKTVKAYMPGDEVVLLEGENVSEEEILRIKEAIIDADNYNYNLRTIEHSFFLVENFEECNFVKVSKGGLWGGRLFRLENEYGIQDIRNKSIKELSQELSNKHWN